MQENDVKLIQDLLMSAQKGDAKSQYRLGVMFNDGKILERDYSQAAKWYALAANQGHAKAQLYLGLLFQNGRGVKQDYKKAAQCYSRAAAQGDSKAQYYLGLLYLAGKGVNQDNDEAQKFFKLSALQGNQDAVKILGRFIKVDDLENLLDYEDDFADDDDSNDIFIDSVDGLLRVAEEERRVRENHKNLRAEKFKSIRVKFIAAALFIALISGGLLFFTQSPNDSQPQEIFTPLPDYLPPSTQPRTEITIDEPLAPPVNAVKIAVSDDLTPEKISSDKVNINTIRQAVKNKKIPGYIFERGRFTINPYAKKIMITGDGVRFRSEPSTSSRILSSMNKGFIADYCGEWVSPKNERWILSIYDKKKNIYGWIFAKYTQLKQD